MLLPRNCTTLTPNIGGPPLYDSTLDDPELAGTRDPADPVLHICRISLQPGQEILLADESLAGLRELQDCVVVVDLVRFVEVALVPELLDQRSADAASSMLLPTSRSSSASMARGSGPPDQ